MSPTVQLPILLNRKECQLECPLRQSMYFLFFPSIGFIADLGRPRRHSQSGFDLNRGLSHCNFTLFLCKDLFKCTSTGINNASWQHESYTSSDTYSRLNRMLLITMDWIRKYYPEQEQGRLVQSSVVCPFWMQNSLTWAPSYPCCIANLLLLPLLLADETTLLSFSVRLVKLTLELWIFMDSLGS